MSNKVYKTNKKVYKKQSNIPNAGLGLFAGEDIKADSLIAEFIGKKTTKAKITDYWSVVYFYDDKHIQCGPDNLASYANDIIILPSYKRNFVELIDNNKNLYESFNNQGPNAHIYQNDNLIRAWLKADKDIKKDEEIFIHYGLSFWFKKEMALSKSIENETSSYVENGIPSYLFTSNSFKNYVNKFYPNVIEIEPQVINGLEVVALKTDNIGGGFIFDMNMFL